MACLDEPYKNLKPVVPWIIDNRPANNITRDRFTIGRQDPGSPAAVYEPGGYQHWEFTPDFFWIDFENPTILNTSFQGQFDKNFHVVEGMRESCLKILFLFAHALTCTLFFFLAEPYQSGFIFMIFEANPMSPTPENVTVIPSKPDQWLQLFPICQC